MKHAETHSSTCVLSVLIWSLQCHVYHVYVPHARTHARTRLPTHWSLTQLWDLMPGLGCRAVSKMQDTANSLLATEWGRAAKPETDRETWRQKKREVNTDAQCFQSSWCIISHISQDTHRFFYSYCMCMCVYVYIWEKDCPAQGVLDVDSNQEHMTLPQEVLQQRTGSRNTRTTSLVSLVSKTTANRSFGHGRNGRSC